MNLLITGAAGYLGSNLLKKLVELNREADEKWNIVAADIREPAIKDPAIVYVNADVRSTEMNEVMKQYNIETVVHLASIVTPGKKSDRQFEYSVDVLGTENVLKACVENKVKRIVLTSSGAAYGYHPDNAEWIEEDHPIRGNEEFAYSYHKRLVEELLIDYRNKHPELEQVIFRVGTILGDSTNNQITSLFEKRMLIGIAGSKSPFVFIWDQDVVECLIRGIKGAKTGVFNVAGDGALTIDEVSSILRKPVLRIPAWLLKAVLFIFKRLSFTQYGEEQVNFLRYRPVLDNKKLKQSFGYTPQLTSKEVFQFFLANRLPGNDKHTHM
ncbi:SDR family oxidoreductase [Bacillus sp. 165]|uniref:SDR family oxidoreductase n=1 Tax=Bacillus sp. 165 TaxID=1529117 RepID=UPI001ADC43B9|nr:SDR family oxidoreductase [Bacillus sp. 165]MBO9131478.1 SDR family oxidoreductase [Bacillus sp. 165]